MPSRIVLGALVLAAFGVWAIWVFAGSSPVSSPPESVAVIPTRGPTHLVTECVDCHAIWPSRGHRAVGLPISDSIDVLPCDLVSVHEVTVGGDGATVVKQVKVLAVSHQIKAKWATPTTYALLNVTPQQAQALFDATTNGRRLKLTSAHGSPLRLYRTLYRPMLPHHKY